MLLGFQDCLLQLLAMILLNEMNGLKFERILMSTKTRHEEESNNPFGLSGRLEQFCPSAFNTESYRLLVRTDLREG